MDGIFIMRRYQRMRNVKAVRSSNCWSLCARVRRCGIVRRIVRWRIVSIICLCARTQETPKRKKTTGPSQQNPGKESPGSETLETHALWTADFSVCQIRDWYASTFSGRNWKRNLILAMCWDRRRTNLQGNMEFWWRIFGTETWESTLPSTSNAPSETSTPSSTTTASTTPKNLSHPSSMASTRT